jgi:hypothetical protein
MSAGEWAMPCLATTVHPASVLPIQLDVSEDRLAEIELTEDFRRIGALADRHPLRHTLTSHIDSEKPHPLTILTGESDLGKSWLVQWCLYRSLLRGRRVQLVDLDRGESLTYVGLLDAMARGQPKARSRIRGALDPAIMNHFLYDATWIMEGKKPPPWDKSTDPEAQLVLPKEVPEKLPEQLFERFLEALEAIAATGPVIVALDHLKKDEMGVIPAQFTKYVVELFIKTIAAGTPKNVRLLIAVRSEDAKKLGLADIANAKYESVPKFSPEEFAESAIELAQLRGHERTDWEGAAAAFMKAFVKLPWRPERLWDFLKAAEAEES